MKNSGKFLLLLFILGFLYRIYLSQLAPSFLIWDMRIYHDWAVNILNGHFPIDCCQKSVGYSFFLAGIYSLFGSNNLASVQIIQVVLDLVAAFLLYLSALRVFRGRFVPATVLLLYLFNPFTSSIAGLRLSETLTIFIISAVIFILSLPDFRTLPVYWLILGFFLGVLIFVKAAFAPFSLLLIPVLIFILKPKKIPLKLSLCVIYLLLASSYPIVINFVKFNLVSLTPPYPFVFGELYATFFRGRTKTELLSGTTNINDPFAGDHPEFRQVFSEFYLTLSTRVPQGLPGLNRKYSSLFFSKLRTDWPVFAANVFRNFFWLWDKYHLFLYTDPLYPADEMPLRLINVSSLLLFLMGISLFIKKRRKYALKNPVFVFTLLLFLFMNLVYPPVANETRYTLPFYPLVYFWAGYSVSHLRRPSA